MRVLYFVGVLGIGGLERYVTRTALKAKDTGAFEPIVCCLTERKGHFLKILQSADVPVYQAPQGWARNPSQLLKFGNLIHQIAPDIIHSQGNFSLVQQLLATRLGGCAVLCVTERSEYILRDFARLRRVIQFHLLQLSGAHYSANSVSTARHVARQVFVSPSRLAVLPNSINSIPSNGVTRDRIRTRLNWKEDDIGLGYIASLRRVKRHDLFIQAIYNLRAEGLHVKACLLGGGDECEVLQQLISKLGLTDEIALPGTVLNVEEYLQAFDIVALFSDREGMPNAILEAMAAGKAIVATSVGGIPEMLAEGAAGLLVPRTLEGITAGLRLLVQDSTLRERLGSQATKQVELHYSIETTFPKLLQYYQKALD